MKLFLNILESVRACYGFIEIIVIIIIFFQKFLDKYNFSVYAKGEKFQTLLVNSTRSRSLSM